MATTRTLTVALGLAALLGAGAAGWFLLRPGPASTASPGSGEGTRPAPDGEDGPGKGDGTGDPPPERAGPVVIDGPDDEREIDPDGPVGGATAEEILAAGKARDWLAVERLLSISGSDDPRVTQLLLDALKDGQYRLKAASLAKHLKDPAALARFLEAAKGGGDENTRSAAILAAANMGGAGVFDAAAEILRSARPGSTLAGSAAGALGTLGTAEAARALVDCLRGAQGAAGVAPFVEALSRVRSPEGLAELGRLANDEGEDARLRESVVAAMGRTRDPAVLPDLLKAARGSESDEVRGAAYTALAVVGEPEGIQELINVVQGADNARKAEAAMALGNVVNKAAGPLLEQALQSPLPAELRPYLVTALGRSGSKGSLEVLGKIAKDASEGDGLRGTAVRSMGQIGDSSAAPAILDVLESTPASSAGLRQQCLGALPGTATTRDLPRLEKIHEGSKEQTPEWFMLRALVEQLRAQAAAEKK